MIRWTCSKQTTRNGEKKTLNNQFSTFFSVSLNTNKIIENQEMMEIEMENERNENQIYFIETIEQSTSSTHFV